MSRHALFLALALLTPFACTQPAADDDDDDGGCEADLDCKGDRLCIDGSCVNPEDASCAPVEASCDDVDCCTGALCALYGGPGGTTVCEAVCFTNAECGSGCCLPLGDSGQSTCAPASYCEGNTGGGPPGPGPGQGGSGGGGTPGGQGGSGGSGSGQGGSPGQGGNSTPGGGG